MTETIDLLTSQPGFEVVRLLTASFVRRHGLLAVASANWGISIPKDSMLLRVNVGAQQVFCSVHDEAEGWGSWLFVPESDVARGIASECEAQGVRIEGGQRSQPFPDQVSIGASTVAMADLLTNDDLFSESARIVDAHRGRKLWKADWAQQEVTEWVLRW